MIQTPPADQQYMSIPKDLPQEPALRVGGSRRAFAAVQILLFAVTISSVCLVQNHHFLSPQWPPTVRAFTSPPYYQTQLYHDAPYKVESRRWEHYTVSRHGRRRSGNLFRTERFFTQHPNHRETETAWNEQDPPSTTILDGNESTRQLVQTTKILVRELKRQQVNHHHTHDHHYDRHHPYTESMILEAKEQLPKLVTKLQQTVTYSPNDLDVYSLQDILTSLAHLVRIQRPSIPVHSSPPSPLVHAVWRLLEERQAERYLNPRRWLACIQAASLFELQETSPLYTCICQRLTKGDALGRLAPHELAQGLMWASRSPQYQLYEEQLLRAIGRRFRKQAVRRNATNLVLMQAIACTCQLLTQQSIHGRNHEDTPEEETLLVKEIKLLAYALLKERIGRLPDSPDESQKLTTRHAASLFECARFVVNGTDPLVNELCFALEHNTTMDYVTIADCSKILNALTHWRTNQAAAGLQSIGQALCKQEQLGSQHPSPKHVNIMCRGLALLHSRDDQTMAPFRTLVERLFGDKEFLGRCNVGILANFLWFASISNLSGSVLETLSDQILSVDETVLVEQCSPKVACRILSSFATRIRDQKGLEDQETDELLSVRLSDAMLHLFDILGEFLLSYELDPLDISNALVSYARVGYALDPGIVDHLSTVLVSRLDDCTVRQVTQSLWSCAKISKFDIAIEKSTNNNGQDYQQEEVVEQSHNVRHTSAMVRYLSEHASQLSTKDVSQTLWAIARLGGVNPSIDLDPLLKRTKELIDPMSAQETSNCLWALSKIKREAFDIIFLLTRHLRNVLILETMNAEEATTVLYSLGVLDIRDEFLFEQMSKLVLQNVETIDPSTIPQVLSAHKMVHLTPPQELLDSWASKKLGIVPVSFLTVDEIET